MTELSELGPSKFHPAEAGVIRDAADVLLFAEFGAGDATLAGAVDSVRELTAKLVEADRIAPDTAERIVESIEACGPEEALAAAA